MTKTELVRAAAQNAGVTQKTAQAVLDAALEAVAGALRAGDEVKIVGFGAFRTRERAERTGRDPRTGAEITIPARRVVVFRPGKELGL